MESQTEILNINNKKEEEQSEIKVDFVEEEEEEKKISENLMFKKRRISIFKLYFHISGPLEIILTILAIIMTIGAGCSNALKAWIFGDSSNNFTFATEIEVIKEFFGKELFDLIFEFIMEEVVKPLIDNQIKKYLIIGAAMSACNFLMTFLWTYLAMRQIQWLKTNYFTIILNQEQGWFDENNAFEFATTN